jgi:hypothetical protein
MPKTRSPRIKITTPSISSRRQRCSTCWEWFNKVWYVAESDRQVTAVNMKIENPTKSVSVTPAYLLER